MKKRRRIRVNTEKEFWGFYPEDDFLILKKVPAKDFEDPFFFSGDILAPNLFCTFVTVIKQNGKVISEDWSEVLPRIVSLGISAEIASKGVEYLKKGGKKLILNIYANAVVTGKKILHGPDLGIPMSCEGSKASSRSCHSETGLYLKDYYTGCTRLTMESEGNGAFKIKRRKKI